MPRRLARLTAFVAGCATFAVVTHLALINYYKVTGDTERINRHDYAEQLNELEKRIIKRISEEVLNAVKPKIVGDTNRPPVTIATTAVTTTSNNPGEQELTLNVLAVSSKLYLVNAYTDLRNDQPAVKVIIYASKFVEDRVLCSWNGNLYTAELSWINFPSDELATWRAGYLTCVISDVVRDTANTDTITFRVADPISPGSSALTMPLRHPHVLKESSSSFCACVKSGYGSPSADRFVEWMELNALLGVMHVVMYDQDLRERIRDAMRFYIQAGRLTVIAENTKSGLLKADLAFAERLSGYDATYATGNEPYSQLELLSIQDCFHRSRGRFRYILVADIDEVLMPTSASTLEEMIAKIRQEEPQATSFSFKAASYLRQYYSTPPPAVGNSSGGAIGAAAATYMATYTRRNDISWDGAKAVHDTADTTAINWHRRLVPAGKVLLVNESHGWVHHYRGSCKGAACDVSEGNHLIVDDGQSIIGKFAKPLAERVARVSKALGL